MSATGPLVVVDVVTGAPEGSVVVVAAVVTVWPVGAAAWAEAVAWDAVSVGVGAGCLVGMQAPINSRLGKTVGSLQAATFSFLVGTALLLVIAAVTYTPGAFRIGRSVAVGLNQMDFVQVARARGEGRLYIARTEILPNMLNPVLADFGLRFVFVVLLLSGLSFLGLGVQPPHADLGSLVRENTSGLGIRALAAAIDVRARAAMSRRKSSCRSAQLSRIASEAMRS